MDRFAFLTGKRVFGVREITRFALECGHVQKWDGAAGAQVRLYMYCGAYVVASSSDNDGPMPLDSFRTMTRARVEWASRVRYYRNKREV